MGTAFPLRLLLKVQIRSCLVTVCMAPYVPEPPDMGPKTKMIARFGLFVERAVLPEKKMTKIAGSTSEQFLLVEQAIVLGAIILPL